MSSGQKLPEGEGLPPSEAKQEGNVPKGMPPKSPINKGRLSKGTPGIPHTYYPGGEKTFLGCFQRVKVEGRRGRGYWEWKAAELRRKTSGHEGDDELTSLESDTMGRRSATTPKESYPQGYSHSDPQGVTTWRDSPATEGLLGHKVGSGVRVLPPYMPFQKVSSTNEPLRQETKAFGGSPSQPLSQGDEGKCGGVERCTIKSFEQPRLTPLFERAPPPKEPPSSSPSPPAGTVPSAPPKELLYADSESRRRARSQPLEGHGNQSVGHSDPSKYFGENRRILKEKEIYKDHGTKDNLKSVDTSKESHYSPQTGYSQYFKNEKYDKERKLDCYPSVHQAGSDKCLTDIKSQQKYSLPSCTYHSDTTLNTTLNDKSSNTLSSVNSLNSRNYAEYEPDTKPLLRQDSSEGNRPTNQPSSEAKSRSGKEQPPTPVGGLVSGRTASVESLRRTPANSKKDSAERRSGALVWVSQPGGGAKLEWVPTPGLSTLRAVPVSATISGSSSRGRGHHYPDPHQRGGSLKSVVAGPKSSTEGSTPKGIIKRGDEGGGGGGGGRGGRDRGEGFDANGSEARAGGSGLARAASDNPRAVCDGNASRFGVRFQAEGHALSPLPSPPPPPPSTPNLKGFERGTLAGHSNDSSCFENGLPKNVLSSAPGVARPEGRTYPPTGEWAEKSSENAEAEGKKISEDQEDKIVTVAGKSHGQTVRIRVRPEVHAYLSSLPVIRGGVGSPKSPAITARRDSIHSANSSSASGLTVGSGEGSVGYQEQDYEAVVDEYVLLKKAVDDHDPEALRLLTATEAALYPEGGGGGSEYPYLREMKERLLISKDAPLDNMEEPSRIDAENQLLEVHQTPVGTVVKLNADGYGSHTSPTHRVESFYTGTLESRKTNAHDFFPKNAKTSSFITLSLLYATLLVVVCLGFVLSEVLTHNVPLYYYEAFFTYLYGLSIFFLLYIFCYLLSDSTRDKKAPKNQKVRKPEVLPTDGSPTQEKLTTPAPKPRKQKTSDNDHSHGSFFLRIGAIAFGLGTMIYNGLEFGVFFEIPMDSPCYQILRGVNPLLQLVFTFMQMYFIFMNARLNIHKFKFIARFGLMHIVATNICVWVRTLVRESLKEINEFRVTQGHTGEDYMIMGSPSSTATSWDTEEDLVNRTCERMEIMGSIVSDSAPYLYPFIVEYSLIGAAVVYIMWKHIGRNPKFVYDPETADGMSVVSRRCHSKVDCIGASKGLFCGLLVLVATLICLILFFVLIHQKELRMLAIYLADVSHCGIMFLSIIAIFIGFCRVRHLKFFGEREEELDDILLMVSAFGLFAYAIFSAVAGSLSAFTEEPNLLVMVTGILSVIQVMIQMVFIKDTQRRQVALPEQERTKPGRQIVTFLLICNLAMWVIYTFETQKVEANPVQLEFFGKLSWTILLRCTLPLAIFHRFHSSVVLAAIWKNSYKTRLE